MHLAGGGLELEPPSTTFHYLPPRRVRTLVPYFPASDDSGIVLSNTHRASEIQTNRGIGKKVTIIFGVVATRRNDKKLNGLIQNKIGLQALN